MDSRKIIGLATAGVAAVLFAAAPAALRAKRIEPLAQLNNEPAQFAQAFGTGGWLGVSIAEVNPDTVKQLKLREERGALITAVAENGPGAKAGLKKDDVVTEYDGMKVQGIVELARLVRETPPGRAAQITVWRDGHAEKLSAQIGQAPAAPPGGNQAYGAGPGPGPGPGPGAGPNFRFAPGFGPQQGPGREFGQGPERQPLPGTPTLGVGTQDLTGQLGAYFGAPNGVGVLVTDVEQGAPADKAGLKAGDVIIKLDNQPIRNVGELRNQLRQHAGEASVTLDVLRKGAEMTLTATPEQPPANPGGDRPRPL